MKLLAIEMSRLTVLFDATRIQGQVYLPHAAAGLVERYSFASPPQSFTELKADRVEFKHGVFEDSGLSLTFGTHFQRVQNQMSNS